MGNDLPRVIVFLYKNKKCHLTHFTLDVNCRSRTKSNESKCKKRKICKQCHDWNVCGADYYKVLFTFHTTITYHSAYNSIHLNEKKSVSVVSAHSLCENMQRYKTFDSIISMKSHVKRQTRFVTCCLLTKIEAKRAGKAFGGVWMILQLGKSMTGQQLSVFVTVSYWTVKEKNPAIAPCSEQNLSAETSWFYHKLI